MEAGEEGPAHGTVRLVRPICWRSLDTKIRRPKVHSYKDLQKATFTMYDAIPSSSSLASLASPNPTAQGGDRPDVDAEVAKFLPLLQDYLKSACKPSFNV